MAPPSGIKLPARPHLDWYRKAAKKMLLELRARDPGARLADAQLAVARQHGFSSWRKLKAEVESVQLADSVEAMFSAIHSNRIDAVRELLDRQPTLVHARTPGGETPLHLAAEHNSAALIDLLLARGADPDLKYGQSAHTSLSWAVTVGAFDAAAALRDGGVKPDLFCAAGLGDLNAVRSFFDRRGNPRRVASTTGSSRFASDGTPLPRPPTEPREVVSDALYIASRCGRVDVVRYLLDRDADPDFRAYMGGTSLHWAHFNGNREVIGMLRAAGGDAALRDHVMSCTPRAFGICVPANWGLGRMVSARLKEDASLANVFEGRGTPLHEAARGGHVEVIRLLLGHGADPSARDAGGCTPRDLAMKAGHDTSATLLQ
jgi:ankyrin repeat protein